MQYQVFITGRRAPMRFDRLSTAVYYRQVILQAGRQAHIVVVASPQLSAAA